MLIHIAFTITNVFVDGILRPGARTDTGDGPTAVYLDGDAIVHAPATTEDQYNQALINGADARPYDAEHDHLLNPTRYVTYMAAIAALRQGPVTAPVFGMHVDLREFTGRGVIHMDARHGSAYYLIDDELTQQPMSAGETVEDFAFEDPVYTATVDWDRAFNEDDPNDVIAVKELRAVEAALAAFEKVQPPELA